METTATARPAGLVRRHADSVFTVLGGAYNFLTDHAFWYEQNRLLATHWGHLPPGATVLDLGAGTGVGTLELAREAGPTVSVIGLDVTPGMIARAERHRVRRAPQLGNVRFVVGDAAHMPDLPDASVCAVVANSFLYLVPDPMAVLREVRRVLVPGGRLVFMEPRAEGSFLSAVLSAARRVDLAARRPFTSARMAAAMVAWRAMSGLAGRRSMDELRAMLTAAGLCEVAFYPTLGGLGHHVVAQRPSLAPDSALVV